MTCLLSQKKAINPGLSDSEIHAVDPHVMLGPCSVPSVPLQPRAAGFWLGSASGGAEAIRRQEEGQSRSGPMSSSGHSWAGGSSGGGGGSSSSSSAMSCAGSWGSFLVPGKHPCQACAPPARRVRLLPKPSEPLSSVLGTTRCFPSCPRLRGRMSQLSCGCLPVASLFLCCAGL